MQIIHTLHISNIGMDTNVWPGFTSHHHFALFSRARRRGAHRVDSPGRCFAGSGDASLRGEPRWFFSHLMGTINPNVGITMP